MRESFEEVRDDFWGLTVILKFKKSSHLIQRHLCGNNKFFFNFLITKIPKPKPQEKLKKKNYESRSALCGKKLKTAELKRFYFSLWQMRRGLFDCGFCVCVDY
jgi:hypothetical protein